MTADGSIPSGPAQGAYTQATLPKLTVPQLKTLCKERKIPGYSKLGKQALVQKLVENGLCGEDARLGVLSTTSSATPANATAHIPTVAPARESNSSSSAVAPRDISSDSTALPGSTSSQVDGVREPVSEVPAPSKTKAQKKPRKPKAPQSSSPSTTDHVSATSSKGLSTAATKPSFSGQVNPGPTPVDIHGPSSAPSPSVSQAPSLVRNHPQSRPSTTTQKRARPSVETMPPPPPKKQRVLSSSSTPNVPHSFTPKFATTGRPPAPVAKAAVLGPTPTVAISVPASAVPAIVVPAPAATAPAKRFKPLVVNKAKISASSTPKPSIAPTPPMAPVQVRVPAATEESLSFLQDFEASVPALRPITLPPSLAQRKRVHRWAVILSGLSNKERAACALVSRAFRYAGAFATPGTPVETVS